MKLNKDANEIKKIWDEHYAKFPIEKVIRELLVAVKGGNLEAIDKIMEYHKDKLIISVPNDLSIMIQRRTEYLDVLSYMVVKYDLYLTNNTLAKMCYFYDNECNTLFEQCIDKVRRKLYTEDLSLMYLRGEYELLERAIIVGVDLDCLNIQQARSLRDIAHKANLQVLEDVMEQLCEGC